MRGASSALERKVKKHYIQLQRKQKTDLKEDKFDLCHDNLLTEVSKYLAVASPIAFRVVKAFIAPFQSVFELLKNFIAAVDASITFSGQLLSHIF